jgi:hypothetical protein
VVAAEVQPKKTMRAFSSERELAHYLRELTERQKRFHGRLYQFALASPEKVAGVMSSADEKSESVTNVQHAGVDEGGIVKVHGNHLVVLRRGRLFTISLADGELEPISSVNAFSPDIDPRHTWYDEMLISGDTLVVIGYSYERGGTEASLFHINSSGELAYQPAYQLRSNDYYSSRNYSSRLIGTKLIFYTPLYLGSEGDPLTRDKCRTSCVDWYGNARPLFVRDRVIALLGYELVEGSREGDRIPEIRRVNYAPGQTKTSAASSK